MKVYELTFADPEVGFFRVWKRNKRDVARYCRKSAIDFPLRRLMTTKYLDISTEKTEFVKWLNINASRK